MKLASPSSNNFVAPMPKFGCEQHKKAESMSPKTEKQTHGSALDSVKLFSESLAKTPDALVIPSPVNKKTLSTHLSNAGQRAATLAEEGAKEGVKKFSSETVVGMGLGVVSLIVADKALGGRLTKAILSWAGRKEASKEAAKIATVKSMDRKYLFQNLGIAAAGGATTGIVNKTLDLGFKILDRKLV
jgi:hypothetical protein